MTDEIVSLDYEFQYVRRKLRQACEDLLINENELFFTGVNERSITHRLAVRLEILFDGMDVDCEYNRDLNDPKRLPIPSKKIDSKDTAGVTVYPDIIVHKRGSRQYNLLVIEAKKNANTGSTPTSDKAKLEAFTDRNGDFKYQFGAFVNFQIEEEPYSSEIRWYANGKVYMVSQANS